MNSVLEAVAERLMSSDESQIRIPEICEATGVNYGSVYHHFGSREGVIEAAYEMIFCELVEEDIAMLDRVSISAQTFDDFVTALVPLVENMTYGEQRRDRRALRLRIIAAAQTRPELKTLIGSTQIRITDGLTGVVAYGQSQGWLRDDLAARSIAVFMQALIFGRNLDDISMAPIGDQEWGAVMGIVLSELMKSTSNEPLA
jgi:AcrR family transcriptional regulator